MTQDKEVSSSTCTTTLRQNFTHLYTEWIRANHRTCAEQEVLYGSTMAYPICVSLAQEVEMGKLQVFAVVALLSAVIIFYTLEAPVLWPFAAKLSLELAFAAFALLTVASLLIAT